MRPSPNTQPGLDAYTETCIRCAIHRLVTAYGVPSDEQDDFAQQLRLLVIEALADYDAARAQRNTFIAACVERRAWNLLRARRRQHGDQHRVVSLDVRSETDEARTLADCRPDAQPETWALRTDVAMVLDRLPPRLRAVCALIPTHAPFAIAQELGLTKHAVYRDVELIRAAFVEAGLAPMASPVGN